MRLEIFAVFDKAVMSYLPPFFVRSKGEALRSFTEAANDEKHQFNRHASDYYLAYLGSYEDSSGHFTGVDPVRIVSAYEVIVDNPFKPELEDKQDAKRPLPS